MGKKFNLIEITHDIAFVHAEMGSYKKAFDTYLDYQSLKDSLNNLDNKKYLSDLEKQYDTEKKEKEIDPVSPVAPATVQHPNDGEAITLAPPISAHPSQDHLDREEGKSAQTRGRNNLRRSSGNHSRGARFESPQVRDGTQAAKGFWDWSR